MQSRISCILSLLGLALLSACGNSSSTSSSTTTTSVPPVIFYSHNAVFLNSTTVWAWGDNESGQIGNGTTSNSSIPVRSIARFRADAGNGIAVGSNHTLAFQNNSTIRAWGFNGFGQLGNGVTASNQTPNSWVPVAVRKSKSKDSLTGVIAVAAGGYHSLALDRDSNVWSWGKYTNGQLGRGNSAFVNLSSQTADRVQLPISGSYLSGATKLAAGGLHSLALIGGNVWAWGDNVYGQVGNGSTINTNVLYPEQVTAILTHGTIVQIAAGGSHSLALDSLGNVWGWGYNYFGQVGDGTRIDRYTPVSVTGLSGITMIAAGLDHSLAYNATTDSLYAWGFNQYGQLGEDTAQSLQIQDSRAPYESSPKLIQNFKLRLVSGTIPESIFATGHHSMARKIDGSWWSWGDNTYGQLGNATSGITANSSIPIRVRGF